MYKIRKIQFFKHPILGDLALDFCDNSGRAVDTVIFAGENGTGKSTLLNELYNIASYNVKNPCKIEIEINGEIINLDYSFKVNAINNSQYMHVTDNRGLSTHSNSEQFKQRYSFNGIYSDVDINFNANELSTVTSLNLDTVKASRKSTSNFPTEIKQLLIDIQALDDSDIARTVREHPNVPYNDVCIEERMKRFTVAFNKMFENLSYSNIINVNNHKSIIFHKFNKLVDIDNLSSGEKQIVYRGCFLLKDINAITGTFVFIDEPEISLHPIWQKKIMNFYKDIYTNDNGIQTSQIFAVTHSPFVVHNEYRKNDKVIVLSCDNNGDIIVKDKPEYFKCNSVEIVEDAFNVNNYISDDLIVYLAGRTDEKYFNKAIEVFEYDIPFKFKWIGYINDDDQEVNTGDKALDKVNQFLISRDLQTKNVCLYDCDANKSDSNKNNVYIRSIPSYENSKKMKKGIENALVLDDIDTAPYYSIKIKEGDYGDDNTIVEFKKMEFCNYICSLENEDLKIIFGNLKSIIEMLMNLFNE